MKNVTWVLQEDTLSFGPRLERKKNYFAESIIFRGSNVNSSSFYSRHAIVLEFVAFEIFLIKKFFYFEI